LSYFHPNPREVLMIGLSSGSWAQVIANHPQVQHLTIVEINPGYLRLIRRNSEVASLLRNPKVQIEIDDGRRWLVRNTGRKFDAIVMNTTFHWRSNASNLLSSEFLQLIREHLNPGGCSFTTRPSRMRRWLRA
jgi:spermidine synthase